MNGKTLWPDQIQEAFPHLIAISIPVVAVFWALVTRLTQWWVRYVIFGALILLPLPISALIGWGP